MSNLVKYFEKSFREHRNLPAMTDCHSGQTLSYFQLASRVDAFHKLFASLGIRGGDKVALVGKNSIDWVCAYAGIITYGASVVPILSDFNPADIAGIVTHSDARMIIADKQILSRIDSAAVRSVEHIFCLGTDTLEEDPSFDISGIHYADIEPDFPSVISYTSGTTGSSKGVMIPLRSLTFNVEFAIRYRFHYEGSHVLALLPYAHAYGCAFDLLTPLCQGSHIFILGRIPTPGVVLEALTKVKPNLICTVPLVMDKIVRKSVMPQLEKQPVRTLIRIPLINKLIYKKIGAKLREALGGNIKEINMGGAALARDVETLLRKVGFPFTVGYGMTECGPMISYTPWRFFRPGSCGHPLEGVQVRIDTTKAENGLGEICIKGDNVMLGYYKNPEATAAVLEDGWLRTGDIGYEGPDGTLYLRGRCKSMILGPSGQNIYPEEIEAKLNNMSGVSESLVYEKDGKLYALAVPDETMEGKNSTEVKEYIAGLLTKLNASVAPFEKLVGISACSEPFEKTPKQSIKRFLYPLKAKFL